MAKTLLRLEGVAKSFGQAQVLQDITLDVAEGEVFSILGSSGCGKTTTLRVIAGLEVPDVGRVLLGDRVLVSTAARVFVPPHRREMGMVFQSYAIWPHKTVFENVAYPLRVRRMREREVHERVRGALRLVGLDGLEDRPAPHLSGGQQQRVALARALVYEPRVLLLDEPFSNLDAKLREQMRLQVKLLLREVRITTVFVTHDQVEALSLSDRVALLRDGRVEQVGAPKDLYDAPASAFVRDFLGRTVLLRGAFVGSSGPGRASIRLESLAGATISAAADVGGLAPGQAVVAALRPEDLRLVSNDEAGTLRGRIEALLFSGERYECRVRLASDEVVLAHAPRSTGLREGDEVGLILPEEGIGVWPLSASV